MKILAVLACILSSYGFTISDSYRFSKNFTDSVSKQIMPSSLFGLFENNTGEKAIQKSEEKRKKLVASVALVR